MTGPAGLDAVLPAAGRALGIDLDRPDPGGSATAGGLDLPEARRVVVVLLDGLGSELLAQRSGHAPFLTALSREALSTVLCTAYPSTTATSIATFGTGLLPGTHGLVGTEVLDPERDVMFSELAWDSAVDPRRWQPEPTVFQQLAARGVSVVQVGPAYFEGSGLTEAALRGARFVAAADLAARRTAAVQALATAPPGPALVYLYWGDIDKIGHVHGCGSWQWGQELEAVDAELSRLADALPSGTLLLITADHGMVDVPYDLRLDVAHEPELAAGVRFVGGEARAAHLYCEPGAADDVAAAWRERLGERMQVITRAEAIGQGWFGPVRPHVLDRIGDVLTSAREQIAVVDSRTARPEYLALIGLHGARTSAECLVPLLTRLC